jgi:hypothetical protein
VCAGHAAALALVGWYMMVPPFSDTAPYANVNSEAPISCWDQTGTEFASQAICEEFIKKLTVDSRNDPSGSRTEQLLNRACFRSRCRAAAQHRSKLIRFYHVRRPALSLPHRSSRPS